MADSRTQYTAWQRNSTRDPARYNPNYIMGGGGLYNSMYFPDSNIFSARNTQAMGTQKPWDWSNQLIRMQSITQNNNATQTGYKTPTYTTPAEIMGKNEFNIFNNWDAMKSKLGQEMPKQNSLLRSQWDLLQNDLLKAGRDPMKLGWIIGQSASLFSRAGLGNTWIPEYQKVGASSNRAFAPTT